MKDRVVASALTLDGKIIVATAMRVDRGKRGLPCYRYTQVLMRVDRSFELSAYAPYVEGRNALMSVGYIGLGAMGGALARRLLPSRTLHVCDRNPDLTAAFAELGGVPARTPADIARHCDVIFICVPRSSDVRNVIFGEHGLVNDLKPGTLIVDQTSGDPNETRLMASEIEKREAFMADAPVSGGIRGANAGTIAIMVGAEVGIFDRARPILETISPNIFHCGGIGSGQVMKLVNNTISACIRLATVEAVAMGLKNGLELSTITDVLNSGGARSRVTENLLPALVKREQSAHFALSLLLKDLNLAIGLAADSGVPLHFGHLARSMLQVADNQLGPNANLDEIVKVVAGQAGVTF
jgi:3-hydroxyisobutyrate dehydrogenase